MNHNICNLYCQPVSLLKVNVDGVADFFENTIKPKNPNIPSNTPTNTNLRNYHNGENVFEIYDELKQLENEILNVSNFVYQEILNHDSELKITNAWINECELGGGQVMHNHCNSIMSGTVYLRTDENTNITFLNKHVMSYTTNQIVDNPNQEKENKYGYYYHRENAIFSVNDGDCLIWPSYLNHGYSKNKTPGRLSLSFNLLPIDLNCIYKFN